MERDEGWKAGVASLYLKSSKLMSRTNFLKSCVSEGLVPDGIKGKLNIAIDVNNQQFIQSLEKEMDFHSSRVLDKVYIHSQEMEARLEIQQEEMMENLRRTVSENEIQGFIKHMKREHKNSVLQNKNRLKKKLINLRAEKSSGRLPPEWSRGSTRVKGFRYVREHLGAQEGARFPQNLHPHRRNRPHRSRYAVRPQHIITEEELAARDPLILTKDSNFKLPAARKELIRLGPKTCPTPEGPV